MNIEEKKIYVSQFFEYMGDPDQRPKALAMMSKDATWWIPGIGAWTKEQLAAGMSAADKCFTSKVTANVLGITAEGDRVAFESVGQADCINGERYANRYHCLVLFKNDEIVEVREYCDTKYAADTLGPLMTA